MSYTDSRQQRRRYFIKCAVTAAMFFLVASACAAQSTPVGQRPELPWAHDLNRYPGLLNEFGQLIDKLQHHIQFPAARGESRLLPLLPASTVAYSAFPNYGDAVNQTLTVFRQELQESSILRDWWEHGELATEGPKLEDSLEKFYQLQQYLGDEIVVSGAMDGPEPRLLIAAEVRKPGLKTFLEQMAHQIAGKAKPGVRVLDSQELATVKEKGPSQNLVVLVRPDFVVAAFDLATLRTFNARLEANGREFVATPFGQRVVDGYRGGVTILGALDLQKILKQVSPATKQDATFQSTGFADMKYLVWQHKSLGEQTIGETELSFSDVRRGAASWLAKPASLGSLDFVSPKAMMAGSLVLSNPTQIFDDVKGLAGPSSSEFAAIAAGEKALNLSLKDDLLSLLGGEVTLELDAILPPQPKWRAILGVTGANHLQQTLTTLLAAAHFEEERVNDGDVTYHTVQIPSGKTTTEIGYAFVDEYLVIGSSREMVAEAVALHKFGGSLRKSKKLLASLPPGHTLDASALLYEDPIAIAALQLRRFAPGVAESLEHYSSEATPAVICVYGDARAIREASRGGAFDVGAVLVVAAVAIPNLLRSRTAANEAAAVGSLRTVNTAQVVYESTYPKRGFAPDLASLGSDPRGRNAQSADRADLIDESLAGASCTATAWCTKSGYQFRVTSLCKLHLCKEYVVVATPVDSNTGTRTFCSTSDGVIRSKSGPLLTSPVSESECKVWPPLQ